MNTYAHIALTKRLLLLGLALGIAAIVLFAGAGPAGAGAAKDAPQTVSLNGNVRVNGSVILLGDLFEGTGDKATTVVAYAPDPGSRAIFDANWLYRVARAYGLNWKPLGMKHRAVVERASAIIGREEIEDHILTRLIEKGVDPDMSIEVSNRMLRLLVPADSAAAIAVEDVTYDPRSRRFVAIVVAPADSPSATRTRVTGRLYNMQEIPVVTRRILKGEIIRAEDIKWVQIKSERLQQDTIISSDGLIGMSPKRGLAAEAPVRISDVGRPILIKKGSLVTMVLRAQNMTLTSQGVAQDNGSDGETIRIVNTQSNKTVQAIVVGAGQVRVVPASHLAMY